MNDFMFEARERGIIFDLGHGAGSFWFRNAARAIEQDEYVMTALPSTEFSSRSTSAETLPERS